jgi:hypothetical protein
MPSFEARRHRLYIIGAGKQCLPAFPSTHSGWILLFDEFFLDATCPQGLRYFPRGSPDQGENQGVK